MTEKKVRKWDLLSPEEKKEIRKRQRLAKEKRSRYEKQKEERRRARYERDRRSAKLRPGDWVRFRNEHCPMDLCGKIALIQDWDDDGHNHERAARNKKVIFLIEPHLADSDDECKTYRGKLQEVVPLNEMEVIAEASR